MLRVEVQRATKLLRRAVPTNREFAEWIGMAAGSRASGEVVVRIVDERESARLNIAYRGKAGPTNVLSFVADPDVTRRAGLYGDIVICAGVVRREAREQQKSMKSHWAHLAIHGMLHLLGYDHVRSQDAQRMEQQEIKLMRRLGFSNPYVAPTQREYE